MVFFGETNEALALGPSQGVVRLKFLGVLSWFSAFGGRIFLKKAFLFSSKDYSGTRPLLLEP